MTLREGRGAFTERSQSQRTDGSNDGPTVCWDGHSHSQFCHHGSHHPLEAYVERAIHLGLHRYSVTEHPPLPSNWIANDTLLEQLAMPREDLGPYFKTVAQCQERFGADIEILRGLELDYLPGAESFTRELVAEWSHQIEDVIISVHFLEGTDGMHCMDDSSDEIRTWLIPHYGTMDAMVDAYYDLVERAIDFVGTFSLPLKGVARIGHMNLVEKFKKDLPTMDPRRLRERQERLLPVLERTAVGVDVNVAGLRKPSCGKPYVDPWFMDACAERGIPLVFGSDAHSPQEVGSNWEWFVEHLHVHSPD